VSTTAEGYQRRLIEGINKAFGDSKTVLVRALEYHRKGDGVSFGSSTGLTLTIGDRVAYFNNEGRLLEQGEAPLERSQQEWAAVKDKKPQQFAAYCRGLITEAELFAMDVPAVIDPKELAADITADKARTPLTGAKK
jgi:hypothetical protein